MKVYEVIERIVDTRGQQYSQEIMIGWLNEIEGRIYQDIVEEDFIPISDDQRELKAPERFQDIYINYICAKIDYSNQEIEKYNMDVVMYNTMLKDYGSWHLRTYGGRDIKFSKF